MFPLFSLNVSGFFHFTGNSIFRSGAANKACKTPPLRQRTDCLTTCVNVQFTDLLINARDFAGAQAIPAIVPQHLLTQSFVHLTSNKPHSEKGKLYRNAPLQQSLFQIPLPQLLFFPFTLSGIVQDSQLLPWNGRMD